MVEGAIVDVPQKGMLRLNPSAENIKMDTTNILFIVGGAFEGIEKIISNRIQGNTKMGFGAKVVDKNNLKYNNLIHKVTAKDLEDFGMMPEFVGRFTSIATLDELQVEDLIRVLTEPKDSLVKQYKALFSDDGVELNFTEGALKAIAEKAFKMHTGARSLKTVLEEILFDYMYSIPDDDTIKSITINEDFVKGKGSADVIYKTEEDIYENTEEKISEEINLIENKNKEVC